MFAPRRSALDLAGLVVCLVQAFLLPQAAPGESRTGSPPLGYASFVCWDYAHLPQLRAWKETEWIIAATLAEANPGLQKLPREENGSPGQLTDFLRKLPDAPGRIDLVYLAAHQSPAGQWYFPDGSVTDWGTLLAGLPKLKNRNRVVLLDCCYAQAVRPWPDWPDKIAPACLFASPADRPTPDLFVFWRRPVDWAELFPGASRWLRQHHVNNSDERISYLGLVWLEAWTREPSPPRTLADWGSLAQAMTDIAGHASTQIHAKFVSDLSASFPP